MTAIVYTIGNFKGGTGKTKNATMLAYDNAKFLNRKTLFIDIDPQANATTILARTGKIDKIENTITEGIKNNDLNTCIVNIDKNLDLIACDVRFRNFKNLISNIKDDRDKVFFLKKLIEPLKKEYDDIFIDVPPTISDFTDNALMASDFCLIAFQTTDESRDGVGKYIGYQKYMKDTYKTNLQVLGIIACMVDPSDTLDETILNDVDSTYHNSVFKSVILYQKRLRRYSSEGIYIKKLKNGNYDQWDYKAHDMYIKILNEMTARRKFLMNGED